ncbi:MAG: VOC family protein [Saprospiraceae bacterium]
MFQIVQTNLTIMVRNMDQCIAFYTDVLGFKIISRYGNHYAQIEAPGIIIGLHPSEKEKNKSENISIGFTVNHFDEAKIHLVESGIVHHERTEEGGGFIHFQDPDGTPLYFIKPKS